MKRLYKFMIIALLALTPLSLGNASLNVTSNNYQVKIEQVDSSYTAKFR